MTLHFFERLLVHNGSVPYVRAIAHRRFNWISSFSCQFMANNVPSHFSL